MSCKSAGYFILSFQNGKAIAVGQCVDFLSGSAQRAIRHKACHIAGDVLGEKMLITGTSSTFAIALNTAAIPCRLPP